MGTTKKLVKSAILTSRACPALSLLMSRIQGARVAVLRYHSILPPGHEFTDRIGPGIVHTTEAFDAQMELLARTCTVVTMNDVSSFVRGKTVLSARSVCITFDDGFRDNYDYAAPILEAHGLRGTFYVTAGCLPDSPPPWFCRLKHAFRETRREKYLDAEGQTWNLSERHEKREAFRAISRRCARLTGQSLEFEVRRVEEDLGVSLTWHGANRLMISPEEISDLDARGHVIGGHGMEHPNIAQISESAASTEIVHCKEVLCRVLGHPIQHFSYPSPILQPHYSEETTRICQANGYESAVTCDRGTCRTGMSPFRIPRLVAPTTAKQLHWVVEMGFLGIFP